MPPIPDGLEFLSRRMIIPIQLARCRVRGLTTPCRPQIVLESSLLPEQLEHGLLSFRGIMLWLL